MLIIFSGLPGTGKTTIARQLAAEIGAVHIRIDSIEQAIRNSGVVTVSLDDAGYRVGYAVAGDNLRLGRIVVADSVNPLAATRDAWRDVATQASAGYLEIEITCSDAAAHRRRVETRPSDIDGLKALTWADVAGRTYHPWHRERAVIDTARLTIEESVAAIQSLLRVRRA